MQALLFRSDRYTLYTGENAALIYCLSDPQTRIPIAWPKLEIDGRLVAAAPEKTLVTDRRFLNDDIEQLTLCGAFGDLRAVFAAKSCNPNMIIL